MEEHPPCNDSTGTAAPASRSAPIRPIEDDSRRRIVAGQAVFDLASAVKELVDNALDATSKSINIRLFNQGLDIVEVTDDGCGVPVESRPYMATPHATSKIRNFDDIYSSHSLGFRGEALFCLANLSENLIIATRTADEAVAQKMEFQRNGQLRPGSVQNMVKKVGTTVAVVRLLEAVPVRRADLQRRIGEQRRKLMRLIAGYAVFSPGVAIQLFDIQPLRRKNPEIKLMGTPHNCSSLAETVTAVFGPKFFNNLTEYEVDLNNFFMQREEEVLKEQAHQVQSSWKIRGYISLIPATGEKREKTGDQQLFSINQRPVDMPRFARMFNEVWRSLCGPRGHPSCVLEFILPCTAYDINVSPDKREVILPQESELLDLVQQHVTQLWSHQTQGQFDAAPSLPDPARKRPYTHSFEDELSYEDDDDDDDDDDDTPNTFNRRYAFSHDVAKIRLQHQFDDGRIRRQTQEFAEEEEKAAARISLSSSSQLQETTTQGDPEDSCEDEDEDAIREDTCVQNTKDNGEDEHIKSPTAELAKPQALSLRSASSVAEDRLWRAAKRRFHETSMTSTQQEEQTAFEQFRADPVSDRYQKRKVQPTAAASSHKLEQFGFSAQKWCPTKRTVSGGRSSPQGLGLSEARAQSEGQYKRVSFDSAATWDAANPPQSSNSATATVDKPMNIGLVLKTSKSNDDSEEDHTLSFLQEKGSESSKRLFTSQESTENPSDPALTVWPSFSDTNSVITAARRERIAMRDRRISFHGTQSDVNGSPTKGSKISLQKEDFKKMEVIGQFNMGFILAKTPDNHLWIMDQHACDEKFNFEKLVKETKIHEQPLIAPMPLDLSPSEESCISDNMEMFEKNGFRFDYDAEKPARHRFSLTAIPHSGAQDGRKAVQFNKDDVSALCAILSGDDDISSNAVANGSGTGMDGSGMYGNNAVRRYVCRSDNPNGKADRIIARLPKAIAMFASRACRGSIMIGKSLSSKEMDRVVNRLAEIDQPWNCPHGRPTMIHAADLKALIIEDERQEAKHLAGPTVTLLTQEMEVELGE